jgi:hypothetical protein
MASKYIDIPLYFGKGSGLIRDAEVVVQKVRLLLQTEPGEFIDLPTFGTPIKQYLYEGITDSTANLLKMTISHAINTWLPEQIRIDNLNVRENRDENQIAIELDLFLLEFNKSVGVVESYNA